MKRREVEAFIRRKERQFLRLRRSILKVDTDNRKIGMTALNPELERQAHACSVAACALAEVRMYIHFHGDQRKAGEAA